MKIISSIFLFFALLLSSSCENSPNLATTNSTVERKAFFDLSAYFQQEIKQLDSSVKVKKVASINEKTETQEVSGIDFEKEFAIFVNSDINRVSWLDKYKIDSTFDAQKRLNRIQYTALQNDLRTQWLSISYNDLGGVAKIEIKNDSNSAVANNSQQLVYIPKKSYTIESKQDVMLSAPRKMKIESTFLR